MKAKTVLFTIIIILSAISCRTIYVDKPYYVTVHDSINYVDTFFVLKTDTVKRSISVLKNKDAIIDTKYFSSKAWIASDSLYLQTNLKDLPDTVLTKNTIRYITNTPAPVIVSKTEKIYTHSDRFLENIMYVGGWIFYGLIFLGIIGITIKIAAKLKI